MWVIYVACDVDLATILNIKSVFAYLYKLPLATSAFPFYDASQEKSNELKSK